MTTQLDTANQAPIDESIASGTRVLWLILGIIVMFVVLLAWGIFNVKKYSKDDQKIQRTPVVATTGEIPPCNQPEPTVVAPSKHTSAPKNVAPRATNTPPRAIEPAWVAPPLPSMTVAPPRAKRSVEPLTPAEQEFQRQLADFERKTPK